MTAVVLEKKGCQNQLKIFDLRRAGGLWPPRRALWVTIDFESLLILGHFLFRVTFDLGSLLLIGHFWFWVTFGFGSLLILGHF